MKDWSEAALTESRPTLEPSDAVEFCLRALFDDKDHYTTADVVAGLTFEELIGALLLARDVLKRPIE